MTRIAVCPPVRSVCLLGNDKQGVGTLHQILWNSRPAHVSLEHCFEPLVVLSECRLLPLDCQLVEQHSTAVVSAARAP
jgi:hypothetical protein